MIFPYTHNNLGDLEVMVTDYDKENDIMDFMVTDESGEEVDYKAFEQDLIKTAKALRDDSEAQQKFEDLKHA